MGSLRVDLWNVTSVGFGSGTRAGSPSRIAHTLGGGFREGQPKVTRLLVLGHQFEKLVRDGVVEDYAALSRLTGLSTARVTQLVNLTLLAPDIQAEILNLDEDTAARNRTFERGLRDLTALPDWNEQRTRQSGRAAW